MLKKVTLIAIISLLFGISANAMNLTIGQSVSIEDSTKIKANPAVSNLTYATLVGAIKISDDLIELQFEVFDTEVEKKDLLDLNPDAVVTFKAYVKPTLTLDDVDGIKVIKHWPPGQ